MNLNPDLTPENATIHDVCEYIGDYVGEVEANGNPITALVVKDILSDFGDFPSDWTPEQVQACAARLASEYVGA